MLVGYLLGLEVGKFYLLPYFSVTLYFFTYNPKINF